MRYKVIYMKLDKLPSDVARSKPDKDFLIGSPLHKSQQSHNMIIRKNQDNFVERKNAINKMVNTETPEDFRDNNKKETFHYQVPRVRASFTLKVAPDSTTPDLPEPRIETAKPTEDKNTSILKCDSSLPESYLTNTDAIAPEKPLKDSRSHVPAQPSVIATIPKPQKQIVANRSNHNTTNDDKDFEIPLEESLRAVEEFIKREKELSKWHVGECVLAKWKGNGLYYKAKIVDIFPTGRVVVVYDSYEVTDEMDYKDLCKFFKKTSNFKKKGRPQEKLKVDTEKITTNNKNCAKKQNKARKQKKMLCKNTRFISTFKKSDLLRRKKILNYYKKSNSLSKTKLKLRAQKTFIKKLS